MRKFQTDIDFGQSENSNTKHRNGNVNEEKGNLNEQNCNAKDLSVYCTILYDF